MASSILEQYRISDLVEWFENKKLRINKKFQRRSVWTSTAKIYLIDTILRELPMPKLYMRTIVDLESKKSYREVIDGQQRVRAIVEFTRDELRLSRKAAEFSGLVYSDLDNETKERFLSYPVSVDQLINATDDDVLEIFSRLNSYTIKLNPQELRHARYQGPFKWAVYDSSRKISSLLEKNSVLTSRQRLRMGDDQLVAEMYGIILNGVTDGGQDNIKKLYIKYEKIDDFDFENIDANVKNVSNYIFDNFSTLLSNYPRFAKAPHFLMLFASVAHSIVGIPEGSIGDNMPEQRDTDPTSARENLEILARVIENEEIPNYLIAFHNAASSSTQRISSRSVRFQIYYKALTNTLL